MLQSICRGTRTVSMWATCNKKNGFIVFGNSQKCMLAAAAEGQHRCVRSHNSWWTVAKEKEKDSLKANSGRSQEIFTGTDYKPM